jgi:hypothetical protein
MEYWNPPTTQLAYRIPQITTGQPWVGCPRNNQKNFSVRTETNQNSICFSCFSICFAKPKNIFFGLFRFVSVFLTGIETTEKNRTLSKETETNRKSLKKRFLLGGCRNSSFFFSGSNWNKPKLNLFLLFSVCFLRNQHIFFGLFLFVLAFWTRIETTKTNRAFGMGN